MIKAIIVDDEQFVRTDIRKRIEKNFNEEIEIVTEAATVAEGVETIENHEPDLLFLDINLTDGTGFDVLTRTSYKGFEVIFITGFDDHAIKAIKVGALDYILKPIDKEEFTEAVSKALQNCGKTNQLDKLVEISNEYFQGTKNKRVILKTAETYYALYEDDILYCSSEGNYTTFYTRNQEKIVVSKTIKKIEEILTEEIFIRCHQSYLVNTKHVLKFDRKGVLIVAPDTKIPVSSRRKEYVIDRIFK